MEMLVVQVLSVLVAPVKVSNMLQAKTPKAVTTTQPWRVVQAAKSWGQVGSQMVAAAPKSHPHHRHHRQPCATTATPTDTPATTQALLATTRATHLVMPTATPQHHRLRHPPVPPVVVLVSQPVPPAPLVAALATHRVQAVVMNLSVEISPSMTAALADYVSQRAHSVEGEAAAV